jgi:hypothetical protein
MKSYEVIDRLPRYFDFSQGYGDKWDISLPLTREDESSARYYPIYNFLYELGENFSVPRDFRRRLNNTTIVSVDDKHHLALTGCGMDYTWEICESYLNLGYYPPAHFCRLPEMVDRGASSRDRRIVRGCMKSLDALVGRYRRDQDWLNTRYLDRQHAE